MTNQHHDPGTPEQLAADAVQELAAMTKDCHCWYIFDRNEGRTETERKKPKADCANCHGSGTVARFPKLRRECPCPKLVDLFSNHGLSYFEYGHQGGCNQCLKPIKHDLENCDCKGSGWLLIPEAEWIGVLMEMPGFCAIRHFRPGEPTSAELALVMRPDRETTPEPEPLTEDWYSCSFWLPQGGRITVYKQDLNDALATACRKVLEAE